MDMSLTKPTSAKKIELWALWPRWISLGVGDESVIFNFYFSWPLLSYSIYICDMTIAPKVCRWIDSSRKQKLKSKWKTESYMRGPYLENFGHFHCFIFVLFYNDNDNDNGPILFSQKKRQCSYLFMYLFIYNAKT